jgi:anti-sigma regulatory factor (Ser/Thr protein kinase)
VDAVVSLPDPARAVRQARRAAAEILTRWKCDADSIEDAVLIVSEIVTNAMRHCVGPVYLRLSRAADYVRVEVTDSSPGEPHLVQAGPGDESGRGLRIINQLATRWGWQRTRDGKQVWADVPYRTVVTRPGTWAGTDDLSGAPWAAAD